MSQDHSLAAAHAQPTAPPAGWLHLAQSAIIARPVPEVFAFAGAYENDPRWRVGVVEMRQEPAGTPAVGATTSEVLTLFGRRQVTVAEVVAYEQDVRTAFASLSGPTVVRGSRLFELSPTGTRFSYELEFARTGLVRLLGPVLAASLNRQIAASLTRLKQVLEHEQGLE